MTATAIIDLEQQLAEAKAAFHQLNIGQAVVKLKRGDREMQYTPANKTQLKQYIDDLTAQLGQASGVNHHRRPFRFQF